MNEAMKEQLEKERRAGIEFCNSNIIECCTELLEWERTGALKDGKVRHLQKMLSFAGHSSMSLAENIIHTAAMEHLVSAKIVAYVFLDSDGVPCTIGAGVYDKNPIESALPLYRLSGTLNTERK